MSKRNKYHYRKIWEQHHGPIPLDELGRTYDIHRREALRSLAFRITNV